MQLAQLVESGESQASDGCSSGNQQRTASGEHALRPRQISLREPNADPDRHHGESGIRGGNQTASAHTGPTGGFAAAAASGPASWRAFHHSGPRNRMPSTSPELRA